MRWSYGRQLRAHAIQGTLTAMISPPRTFTYVLRPWLVFPRYVPSAAPSAETASRQKATTATGGVKSRLIARQLPARHAERTRGLEASAARRAAGGVLGVVPVGHGAERRALQHLQ